MLWVYVPNVHCLWRVHLEKNSLYVLCGCAQASSASMVAYTKQSCRRTASRSSPDLKRMPPLLLSPFATNITFTMRVQSGARAAKYNHTALLSCALRKGVMVALLMVILIDYDIVYVAKRAHTANWPWPRRTPRASVRTDIFIRQQWQDTVALERVPQYAIASARS